MIRVKYLQEKFSRSNVLTMDKYFQIDGRTQQLEEYGDWQIHNHQDRDHNTEDYWALKNFTLKHIN